MMKANKAQQGFSLIELMIAVTLALVAMLAATQLYASTRQTYRLQGMQTRLSEDGRFALSMLQRVIAQAGYRPSPVTPMIPTAGFMSVANGTYLTPTSNESVTVRFIADGTNMMVCDGSLAAANSQQTLTIAKSGSKLQCGTVDWIAPASAGSGTGTELVDFKILYGTDTGPATLKEFGCGADSNATQKARDCVADTYVQASATAAPTAIVSVKVCLVLRTESTDASISKNAAISDCSGTAIANSQADKKLYRTFRSTVMLRNQ